MLLAMADARAVAGRAGMVPSLARLLAGASLSLYPAPASDAPAAAWPLESLVGVARARYLLNRAVQQSPGDFESWLTLFAIAQKLGDPDAQWAAGVRLASLQASSAGQFEVQGRVSGVLRQLVALRAAEPPVELPMDASDVVRTARDLFDRRRFSQALAHIEQSVSDGVAVQVAPPELADLSARLFLIAGDPGRARAAWTGAGGTLLAARIATTHFVEGRLTEAAAGFRASLADGQAPSAARYLLAMSHLERGEAEGVVRECRAALAGGDLPDEPAETCALMSGLAAQYAIDPAHLVRTDAGGERR
jgi:hypothetical protein